MVLALTGLVGGEGLTLGDLFDDLRASLIVLWTMDGTVCCLLPDCGGEAGRLKELHSPRRLH